VSNPNIPFIMKIAVDLFVGREITKDGTEKVAANAQTTIEVATAIKAGVDDPLSGIAAIDAILAKGTTDPAKLAALQTLIGWASTKAAALQSLASGSIASSIQAAILSSACDEAITVATKYLPAAPKQ
jgi:hypothetical protein